MPLYSLQILVSIFATPRPDIISPAGGGGAVNSPAGTGSGEITQKGPNLGNAVLTAYYILGWAGEKNSFLLARNC